MIGMPNHAIAVGDLTGGRVWIEDDEGMSPVENRDEKQKFIGFAARGFQCAPISQGRATQGAYVGDCGIYAHGVSTLLR